MCCCPAHHLSPPRYEEFSEPVIADKKDRERLSEVTFQLPSSFSNITRLIGTYHLFRNNRDTPQNAQ